MLSWYSLAIFIQNGFRFLNVLNELAGHPHNKTQATFCSGEWGVRSSFPSLTRVTSTRSLYVFSKANCYQLFLQCIFFPRNLLRFSAERENMTAATVKTVIVCICWAKLRHFQTCLQCVKERLTAQEKKKKNSLFPITSEEHTTHSKWYIFLNKKLYSAQMWITTIEMRSFIYWMC